MPFDHERDTWVSKHSWHAFQHVELAAFHVDLHDVGGLATSSSNGTTGTLKTSVTRA